MKNLKIASFFLFAVLIGMSLAWQKPKEVKVVGSVEQWQDIVNIIDQSTASHIAVVRAENFIIGQVKPQLVKDTVAPKK